MNGEKEVVSRSNSLETEMTFNCNTATGPETRNVVEIQFCNCATDQMVRKLHYHNGSETGQWMNHNYMMQQTTGIP